MFRTKLQFARLMIVMISVCSVLSGGVICDENRANGQSLSNLNDANADDDYRIAAGYYSRGQWDETVVAFRDLIQRYPNTEKSIEGHFFLGEALMQQGNYGPAYSVYQIFLQHLPNHEFAPRATFRMGESAYQLNNYKSALRLLEIFIREHPHDDLNEFALPYLGEIRLKRGEPQLAQRAYETALRIYPNSHLANKCRFGIAKSFQMQGATEQAIRFYRYLAKQDPSPLRGEANMQIGIIQFSAGNLQDAQYHLNDALPLCHTAASKAETAYWLARTSIVEKDYQKAFDLLESVADYNVNESLQTAIRFDGAVTATKIGNNEVANLWLDALLDKFPDHKLADDALYLKIDLSQKAGAENAHQTKSLIEKFLREYPNSPFKPGVLESTGRAQYANNEFEKSISTFQRLLRSDSHLPKANQKTDRSNWNYLLGLSHIGLNQFEKAESALTAIDPNQDNEQLAPLVQIALATARFGLKDFEHAIANYREFIRLRPDAKEILRARTELTVALAETGRWTEVVGAFSDLEANHAKVPVVLETAEYLAEKAMQNKQPALAARWYTFMSNRGTSPDVLARGLSRLAWSKMDAGETDEAMTLFDRLLAECPDHELACDAAMARAKLLDDEKRLAESAEMYGLVIRRFGKKPVANVARLRRAYALQKIGGNDRLQESRTLLNEYLELTGNDGLKDEAIYQLAWVHQDLGSFDAAHENFQRLASEYPNSKYWADATYRVAQRQVRLKQFDDAKIEIKKLTARTDLPAEIVIRVLYFQGEIAASEGQWELVTASMQKLLDLTDDPDLRLKSNYWLAESMYRQQMFDKSGVIFQQLHDEDGKLEPALRPWVWLRLSQCLGQQNRWAEALLYATAGKTRFPNFESDYEFDYIRGRGMEDAGRLTDCRRVYQLVIDSPRGGSTETAAISQWRIGETYFHQEDYESAIAAYYKVDSLFGYEKWRSTALLQAGKCQEHLNNWKHAVKLYKQLVEQFPETANAKAASQRMHKVALLAKLQTETESR